MSQECTSRCLLPEESPRDTGRSRCSPWQGRPLLPPALAEHLALSPMSLHGGAPMVVLHLCSGRRREGDAHFSLDQFMGDVGRGRCVSIVMVSVDVTIDPARGNLASVEALRVRVDMVVDRRVVGLLGGPPCETWSYATRRRSTY